MEIKTIRNVDEETWRNFKMLASKLGLSMSILLKMMVKEFGKNNKKFWRELFNIGKLLSDEEAEDMIKISERLREERGFRE